MEILIVGAGAVGGYLGAKLAEAGRAVTFLVHETTRDRLQARGIEINTTAGIVTSTTVAAVTSDALARTYDVVLLAVRSDVLASAIEDAARAVGPASVVIPVLNGVAHLEVLLERFGRDRAYGGSAQLAVSLDHGVIHEARPGVALQIGRLDGVEDSRSSSVAAELTVDTVVTTVSPDIVEAMWAKFAFITATAATTCLLGDVIGSIARTSGGLETASAIVAEVTSVTAAARHPLSPQSHRTLVATLTDPTSPFAPSMFRDMSSGRVVESAVLAEFVSLARAHETSTPLVDAALVAVTLHNNRVTTTRPHT